MRKHLLFALGLASLLCGSACQTASAPEVELCNCVASETGAWNLQLSDECIEACRRQFGEDMGAMEAWFKENCDKARPREVEI